MKIIDKLLSLNFIQIVLDEGKDRINWGELCNLCKTLFVDHCLATKAFIGKLLVPGWLWVAYMIGWADDEQKMIARCAFNHTSQ